MREDFLAACDQALADLATRAGGVTLVAGHPRAADGKRYNSASVIRDGKVTGVYDKQRLPNYMVFDEERYFEPGSKPCVFGIDGVSFGVNICEDTWGAQGPVTARARGGHEDERVGINICADSWNATAPRAAREAGANVLLVLNASPYHMEKQRVRYDVMRERVAENGMALVYVNLVGGQDELVFDGGSFVLNREGVLTHQLPLFKEALGLITLTDGDPQPGEIAKPLSRDAEVYDALITGVRDYINKNGFPGAIIGISGGIDSALTLAVAVDALGAERVRAV